MRTFKLRAEGKPDVVALLKKLPKSEKVQILIDEQYITVKGQEFLLPDVELTIETKSLTLSQFKKIIDQVVDGHVMYQTVMPLAKYTGIRK
jgi:hypothetical protein